MAPFGKNFLKARLKNRTKDAEPPSGKEIQVTVCNEEKVVCGVTKHTTCADMIQALLEDHKSIPESKRLLHGELKDFCLVERWKGLERALPPLTRILRLWFAWGDQRPFVHFVLLKTSDFVSQSVRKVGKSKGARPKRWEHSRNPQSLPAEKQKRVVKKAFRKLEKLHKENNRTSPGAEEVDRMVQLILNQDHTIREQIQRMRELDLEIEQFEVQSESVATPAGGQFGGWVSEAQSEAQLQEYLYASEGMEELELQVQRHQDLILHLSQEIDAELQKGAEDTEQEGAAATSLWSPSDMDEPVYAIELEDLQKELKHSLVTGVSLHNQTAEIDKQLRYFDATLVSKDQECWHLAAQLNSLQIMDRTEDTSSPGPVLNGESVSQMVKLKHNQSPVDITDTDSDTGISSTHSQDSLSPCLDFPPPLDSDV